MNNSVLSTKALAPALLITAAGEAALSPASKVLAQTETSTNTGTKTNTTWPKLDKVTVLTRLNDLKNNADLFNQGVIGLCTAAAFFHHIIQKEKEKFYSFSTALYEDGNASLGKLKIVASKTLRNTDYAALALKYQPMPPQADWMLMCALRDSENWFFDFDGSPDDSDDMKTPTKELSSWYEDTGFYSSVEYSDETSLEKIQMIQKTDKNQIALWIAAKLLGHPDTKATHMITLESPITIDKANNRITFNYWTWGQPVQKLEKTVEEFKAQYYGGITATF